jgi:hypothetical protein
MIIATVLKIVGFSLMVGSLVGMKLVQRTDNSMNKTAVNVIQLKKEGEQE